MEEIGENKPTFGINVHFYKSVIVHFYKSEIQTRCRGGNIEIAEKQNTSPPLAPPPPPTNLDLTVSWVTFKLQVT